MLLTLNRPACVDGPFPLLNHSCKSHAEWYRKPKTLVGNRFQNFEVLLLSPPQNIFVKVGACNPAWTGHREMAGKWTRKRRGWTELRKGSMLNYEGQRSGDILNTSLFATNTQKVDWFIMRHLCNVFINKTKSFRIKIVSKWHNISRKYGPPHAFQLKEGPK